MKKSILLGALVAASFAVQAQVENDELPTSAFVNNHLKAEKGMVTTEFGLVGGLLNTDLELNEKGLGLLRFRYFFTDQLALRVGATIGFNTDVENIYGGANQSQKGTIKSNEGTYLINLGVEKHFAGTDRLSPYVGADLMIGTNTFREKGTDTDGDIYDASFSYSQKGANTLVMGIRGVVGADYYFSKHVYLGAEAGLGFLYGKEGTTTISVTENNQTETITLKSTGSNTQLTPSIITGVRVGFVF